MGISCNAWVVQQGLSETLIEEDSVLLPMMLNGFPQMPKATCSYIIGVLRPHFGLIQKSFVYIEFSHL